MRAEAEAANHLRTKAELEQASGLMEAVRERGNLKLAYQRVVENKGAAGVDGIEVAEFKDHLKQHWPTIKAKLLAGSYIPSPVRRVDLPEPQGGVRTLGIPTLTDRLIQQALHQVLSPIFEADFSESSYGFRPGKNAHQAVKAAKQYVAEGRRFVVDMDLEKFFDRVNHDLLMEKLSQKIGDGQVLRLIRRYLEADMMADGVVSPRTQGTPQGGPLSPLLSNILLTELDRELERRGHAFCRYADDCNIYVRSQASGERVMASITGFLADVLKLTVNVAKSAVARPWERKFLGYSLTWHHAPRLRIAPASYHRLVNRVREVLQGAKGRNLRATIDELNRLPRGWMAYFRLSETKRMLEELDGWIRRKLRLHPVASVETTLYARQGPDEGRTDGRTGVSLGLQSTRAVVEQWREPYEPGFPQVVLRSFGAGVAARYDATTPASFMNRRMRNRTSGGVGGRPG
jgi:RNA-directed DNA polymerase